MLYREDPAGLIVTGQPSHAWVSGQLSRAWGNDDVGTVAPWEEVCLAAEQHDLAHSRYAAMLVSLHFTGLYERYALQRASGEERQAMQDFLAREDAFQQHLLVTLRDDPSYASYATPEIVARNRHLLSTWDGLSLALCFGLQPEKSFLRVPTRSGETTLTVTRVGDDPTCGMVAPWPFHEDTVTLRCEGRRLPETFPDEEAMRTALAHAPWVTITLQLVKP